MAEPLEKDVFPRFHKVFRIGAGLDSVLREEKYGVDDGVDKNYDDEKGGLNVGHMVFVRSDGRLIIVGICLYPFRPSQPDTAGDPPLQVTAAMYRVRADEGERIRMPPTPEPRKIAFGGLRDYDNAVVVLEGSDGRLLAARRFGTGLVSDKVVGVHAIGNGVLAIAGDYERALHDRFRGACLAFDKTDEGGLVGGGRRVPGCT